MVNEEKNQQNADAAAHTRCPNSSRNDLTVHVDIWWKQPEGRRWTFGGVPVAQHPSQWCFAVGKGPLGSHLLSSKADRRR